MNILAINGSPKGSQSITLQTVLYLKERFPVHAWSFLNAAQEINAIEKHPVKAMESLKQPDLLLFSYPVYTFLVPSQLYRFIEFMKKENISFENTYAAQILTSKHFYDVTAMEFMKENPEDLGLHYLDAFSADMSDLLKEKGQQEVISFWKHLEWKMQNHLYKQPVIANEHNPVMANDCEDMPKDQSKKIAVVTDLAEDSPFLSAMISRFLHRMPYACDVINLRDFHFDGGCLV